jgi:AAA ATPase domain
LYVHVGMLWTELGRRRHAGQVGWLRERERELAAVEKLLEHRGGVLLIEGRAGVGKTSLVEAACSRAGELGHEVVRARGSELESGFAFGVIRQLFERRLAAAGEGERAVLLAGPAAAVRPLLSGEVSAQPAGDGSFAVLHGLYWLVVNFAASGPVLIAVDDAHWADEPSLRWLAYLAPRLDGLAAGMLVAMRQGDPAAMRAPLAAVRAQAAVLRPALLSVGGNGQWGPSSCAAAA